MTAPADYDANKSLYSDDQTVSSGNFNYNPGTQTLFVRKLVAETKSFLIDHPSKPGYKLQYGNLEGPENGVYVRGKVSGTNMIELPDYWVDLVDVDTITVSLTSCTEENTWLKSINHHVVVTGGSTEFNFIVFAERKDTNKLIVEYPNASKDDNLSED